MTIISVGFAGLRHEAHTAYLSSPNCGWSREALWHDVNRCKLLYAAWFNCYLTLVLRCLSSTYKSGERCTKLIRWPGDYKRLAKPIQPIIGSTREAQSSEGFGRLAWSVIGFMRPVQPNCKSTSMLQPYVQYTSPVPSASGFMSGCTVVPDPPEWYPFITEDAVSQQLMHLWIDGQTQHILFRFGSNMVNFRSNLDVNL